MSVRRRSLPRAGPWPELTGQWRTSLDERAYVEACREVRRRIAVGTVYQVNVCRVLEHDLPDDGDTLALAERLAGRQPRAVRRSGAAAEPRTWTS